MMSEGVVLASHKTGLSPSTGICCDGKGEGGSVETSVGIARNKSEPLLAFAPTERAREGWWAGVLAENLYISQ